MFSFHEHYSTNPHLVLNNSTRDIKSTIYWNSTISTSRDKSATVSCVAPASIGVYQITAEGVTNTGKPVRAVKIISIVGKNWYLSSRSL